MSSNQYHSSKSRLFERLQELDNISYYPETLINRVKFFMGEFQFLDYFLNLQRFIDEPNMLDFTQKIQALFEDVLVDFSELHLPEHSDFCTSNVQNKIWLIKMEIRARYSFPKISFPPSANKDGIDIPKFVTVFIPHVVQNLLDLVKVYDHCSILVAPETLMEHIQDVLKELKLLQNCVCFVSERFIEAQSQHVNFFTHVFAVAGHASMLIWLYLPDLAPEEMNILLSDFLQMKIKPIQRCIRKIYVDVLQSLKSTIQSEGWTYQNERAVDTEASFVETILHNLVDRPTKSNSSQRVALKDHLTFLQDRLNLVRAGIIHVPMKDREPLLCNIDTFIIDVGLLVYSLYNGGEEEEKEDMAPGEVNPAQVLDTLIYVTFRKAFQSNLPRIHGLGYVDFLLHNLKELRSRHSNSLAFVKHQLQIIQEEFQSLQPFLKVVSQQQHMNDLEKIHRCATQLIGTACEVEYIVDACISKELPAWCLERWFLDIMEEITNIKAEVVQIQEKEIIEDAMNTATTHTSQSLARSARMNEELVGFEDCIKRLLDQLIRGTKSLDVISIVGMPGLGKTTLAYKLYYDRLVASHFDIRAECCVSQEYSRKDLLLAILRDATGENLEYKEKQADKYLADQLRKTLFSKRYLIILDDVWESRVWDDLVGCFRDANCGSRIILTTRHREVASYASCQSDPLHLRLFNDDESWMLLRKKVFGEESFSPLLANIGKKIAKKCGGLPLSVTLVAGILALTDYKKVEYWEQLANNLGAHIHGDSRAIMEHSYRNLPYYLRPCFLYFGAFLEDSVIDISKITRLWISEGFIKSCEGKSLEDIAEGYLDNLIGRNLIMGAKKSSEGKIKACRLHDLLHDFCMEKAKKENLLLLIQGDQNAKPPPRFCCRMSVYNEGYHIGEWSSYWSRVSSIILHDRFNCDPVSHAFYTFKFLKVLDLEFTRIDSFPTNLVYLRYLAAQTAKSRISSFIANCWNLETLILNTRKEMSLPFTIWKKVKLRHLHISPCSFTIENAEDQLLENSKTLYDLKTLSNPCFSCVQDAELILRKTPNLHKLGCEVKGVDNFQYYVLNFPTPIEKLKISRKYTSFTKTILPFCISAPNLKNLTLDDFSLHPQHLSEIALLHNLQVLRLQYIRFDNKDWEVSSSEFPQLKVLKLLQIDCLREWIVADDAFPNLAHLVLRGCHCLKEIPSCFAEISSLMSIEVEDCDESVKMSAMDIRETQVEDYLNSDFMVIIRERRDQ